MRFNPVLGSLVIASTLFGSSSLLAAGDAKLGQEKSAPCVACHSVDGNSTDPQYPKIAGQHADYTLRHLKMFKSGERDNAIMAAQVANLSEQDMADLGAYFATQKVSTGLADETVKARGELLFRGGDQKSGLPSCMGCHSPDGRGNPGSKYPSIAGQHATYTKTQLERFRAGTIFGNDDYANKAIMSQVAKNLSDQDIMALAEYIQGLHTVQTPEGAAE